jgi:sterol desaturase/sphingolipid hydroxylase (fatty acid hydroxylase superfamily)
MQAEYGRAALVVPLLVLLAVILEALYIRFVRHQAYPWAESLASFGVAIGRRLTGLLSAGLTLSLLSAFYELRIADREVGSFGDGLVFFLAFELCYYWYHRAAHEVRWFWASHSVHHSANHMNLAVAYRLGWTGSLSGAAFFFAPLAIMGYSPFLIVVMLAVNLFYQLWLHTELIGKLGPFEWIFNTPSHHRVHHATNLAYIDKNYGGVLIIFDRLFGTFAREEEAPRYGLVSPHQHLNPVQIAFHEWQRMLSDIWHAKGFRERLFYVFARPGWRPAPAEDTERRFLTRGQPETGL